MGGTVRELPSAVSINRVIFLLPLILPFHASAVIQRHHVHLGNSYPFSAAFPFPLSSCLPLAARPIIHSSCTKIAFTCHFNRIFVAVVACKAFSFVFFSDFLFFCFSFFFFCCCCFFYAQCFVCSSRTTTTKTTKYYCNFFVDFESVEGVWRGRCGGGAAVVGAQLPVVFSHYFGVFILNAFSLVIVFIRLSLPLLSLSLSLSLLLYLHLHCVFVVLFGEVALPAIAMIGFL